MIGVRTFKGTLHVSRPTRHMLGRYYLLPWREEVLVIKDREADGVSKLMEAHAANDELQ
jgi:hypothetical protein